MNPRRMTNSWKGVSPKYRAFLLGLGLLNIVLLISAIVIAIKCAKVKEDSLHVTHPAAQKLLNKLRHLRGNHSNVIMALENTTLQVEAVKVRNAETQAQLVQQERINDAYHKELQSLLTERTSLKSNVSILEGSCGRCPAGFIIYNTSCYFLSSSQSPTVQKNWHDSRADCISRGSDLIVIDNPEEETFVAKKIRDVGGRGSWTKGYWLGLTDIETENKWVWINNVTETEARYWMDNEPNNHGPDGEDCALIVFSPPNPWKTRYDAKCKTHELNWLCESVAA